MFAYQTAAWAIHFLFKRLAAIPKNVRWEPASSVLSRTDRGSRRLKQDSLPQYWALRSLVFPSSTINHSHYGGLYEKADWRGLEPSICSPFGVPRYQTCDHQSAYFIIFFCTNLQGISGEDTFRFQHHSHNTPFLLYLWL